MEMALGFVLASYLATCIYVVIAIQGSLFVCSSALFVLMLWLLELLDISGLWTA